MIKHTACPKEMFKSVLHARPFDSEEECLDAVLKHKVQKGDAVFIRYEGPKGSGMPEMFYTSEAISSDDGRYQLYVKEVTLDGAGALYEKYEQLKRELADEILSGEGIGQALISREEVLELLGR